MADFQNPLISRVFGVFSNWFLHWSTLMFLWNCFSHVFGILNFWPKQTLLQTLEPLHGLYPLPQMADFQTPLISPKFGVFSSFFSHRTTLMFLWNRFSHVSGIFNFSPKLTIWQRLYIAFAWAIPFASNGWFSKFSHFSKLSWCFFQLVFPQKHSNVLVESFFACFWHF